MKHLATLLITSAVTGASFKPEEITFVISSSGNNDGRPRLLVLTSNGFLPLLFLTT